MRRILAAIGTLLIVSVVVFIATEILPGDAASRILGRRAAGPQLAELRTIMGLDRPLMTRYFDWLGGFVHGDLGNSAAGYAAGSEVAIWDQVRGKLANSLILATITFAIVVPTSLVFGAVSAWRAGKAIDHVTSTTTLLLMSLPEFVVGSFLIYIFFVWLHLLPPVSLIPPGQSPLAEPGRIVLPVLTLLAATVAWTTRFVRAGMLEALRSDYVAQARLNGLPEREVLVRYAMRNALAPSVQAFAQTYQYLLGGILVVETLFVYPGIGKEFIDAMKVNDVFAVQSIAMLLATIYIAINILADFIVIMLVPKLRTGAP